MPFNTRPEVTDASRFDKAITEERAFIATTDIVTVASGGGTLTLTLENPSGSGVTAVVVESPVTTAVAADLELFDGFSTNPSGGTDAGIDNLLLDSGGGTDSGNMNARSGDTFTATNTQDAAVLGGGQGGQVVGGARGTSTFYIEPDRRVVFQVTNDTNNDGEMSISLIWFERSEVFVGT